MKQLEKSDSVRLPAIDEIEWCPCETACIATSSITNSMGCHTLRYKLPEQRYTLGSQGLCSGNLSSHSGQKLTCVLCNIKLPNVQVKAGSRMWGA